MRLLDLFCGAGGAAMGYSRADFDEIIGVDIKPQPRYPFEFVQADALEFLAEHGHEFDAIHASPPCQGYSIMHSLPWLRGRDYPLLLLPTLEMLEGLGKPYVVENVMGARYGSKTLRYVYGGMVRGLPGGAAGLDVKPRHDNPVNSEWRRYHDGALNIRPGYEKVPFSYPTIATERLRPDGRRKDSKISLYSMSDSHSLAQWQGNGAQGNGVGIGHAKGWRLAAEAMGIDWMKRDELTQAIPPAYTEFIGEQLIKQ